MSSAQWVDAETPPRLIGTPATKELCKAEAVEVVEEVGLVPVMATTVGARMAEARMGAAITAVREE